MEYEITMQEDHDIHSEFRRDKANTVDTLRQYSKRLDMKINNLTNGARFYLVCGIITKLCIGTPIIAILCIETFFIAETGSKSPVALALFIVLSALQILSGTFNIFDSVTKPLEKSSQCSTTSKRYSELTNEIKIVLNKLDITDSDVRDLSDKLLYYATREQCVLQDEPLLICIGHHNRLTDCVSSCLCPKLKV